MRTQEIASWSDLAAVVDQIAGGDWIFRGVTDPNHTLIPSIGRRQARLIGGDSGEYDFEAEKRLVEEFRRVARPFLSFEPASDLELLAVGQHHQLPTRLLDWTENLFVAAFFAVQKAGTEGTPVIYAAEGIEPILGRPSLTTIATLLGEDDVFTYRPAHVEKRLIAQHGLFTVHARPDIPYESDKVIRWIVRTECALDIKRKLDLCGINEATLFPDLDGLSHHLGWRHKWDHIPDRGGQLVSDPKPRIKIRRSPK